MSQKSAGMWKAAGDGVGVYKWAVVGMLWFICFFNYADRQAISSVLPKLHTEFGFDKVQQGLIASAFTWVYALGAPFAGYIADRARRKDLILGGCLFWSAVTMLTGWCGALWQFVTVRALEGLGETFYFPASMSLVSDYHGRRTRSLAMSLHQSGVYAGTIIGSWFAAWAAEAYGWRVGFYVFGTLGMALAAMLYLFLQEPRRGASQGVDVGIPAGAALHAPGEVLSNASAPVDARPLSVWATLQAILRKPTVLCLMAAFLGANFVATIFLTWTPTFLVDKFHYRLAAAGLSGSVFIHAASALSVPLGGLAADLLARRIAGGRILVQAAGLLAGSVFVFLIGSTGNVVTLLLSMTAFGLCKGLYDSNIFAAVYDAVEPRARASAAGIMNTVGWGGGALGPLVVGWLAQHGRHASEVENMSEAIAWSGAIYIVAAGFLIVAALVFAPRDVTAQG